MRRVVRRPAVWAAVLYAALAVGFVSPALMPGKTMSGSDFLYSVTPWTESRAADVPELGSNFELLDQALQFEPFQRYARDSGGVPLWNPHVMGGRPFHANAQSAMFSPFSAPARVTSVSRAVAWAAALKLFIAAFGMYLLARALGLRFAAALLAGVTFGFGLWFVSWLAWPLTSVWAWLPWLLALAEVTVRRPGPLPAAGLAVVTALQFFGGHPESSFHVLVATAIFFALRLVVLRREGGLEGAWRPLAAFGGGLLGGALLAGVALVPLLEMIIHSGELDERTRANPDRVKAAYVAMTILPDFWGRPTQTLLPTTGFMNNRAFYAGALPLMLAIAAPVLRPSLTRIAVAAFGVGALGVVLGVPPVHQVVNALPVFSTTHNGRLAVFYLLAVALLAGYALDDLLAERAPARRRWVVAVALALACLPLAWLAVGRPGPSDLGPALDTAWAFARPDPDEDVIRLASLLVWIPFAAAAAAVLVLRLRGRLGSRAFGALAVALVVADLFRIGVGLNPAIDRDDARVPRTAAIDYLEKRRPARFVGATSYGILPPLEPNTAMDFGLYDARGYDYPTEERYSRLWRRAVYGEEGFVIPEIQAPVNARSLRAFDLLSVADVVSARDAPPIREPGLKLAYDGPDARIYRNRDALPRAFLVGGARFVSHEADQLDAVLDPAFDARGQAIVGKPVDGMTRGGPAGRARIVEYEPDRVVIEAHATRRAMLVLTDVDFPGWKATVGGNDAKLQRVDYLLRGVPLYPGSYRVELRYEPSSWRIGWIASLAALAALLLVAALSTASRLRSGRARGRAAGDAARGRA